MFAWSGERRYYIEPQRLSELGYLERTTEPGETHPRTVYRLTKRGVAALRDFASTPARFTPLKSEVLVRLMVADLAGEAATVHGMRALREDVADLLTRLEKIEARAEALPHRRAYILKVTRFMRRLFELHLDLVDELERELDPADERAR